MLGQLAGNVIENRCDTASGSAGMLGNVVAVKPDDIPFDGVNLFEAPRFHILLNCLRHAANQHILTKKPHRLAVQGYRDRLFSGKGVGYCID